MAVAKANCTESYLCGLAVQCRFGGRAVVFSSYDM